MRRLFLLFCLGILLSITLAGCGGDTNIKDAPYANVPLEDIEGNDLSKADVQRLYQAGHQFLAAGKSDNALRIYNEIQSRFPFTPTATQAALESVTAHYIAQDYDKAISAADRFIKQHPRHPHIDYLYYLRGLANYHRNDPGLIGGHPDQRDLSYLKQAFFDFKLLIRNFPNSVYAKDAQKHMIKIRNRLADFELATAEFYLKRHAYVAAARRASYIIEHYQRATATPRALEIIHLAYTKLGLPELAQTTRTIIQASYPEYIVHRTEFYRKRNNNFFGDDGLPGHNGGTKVAKPKGPVRATLETVFSLGDRDEDGTPVWNNWFTIKPTDPSVRTLDWLPDSKDEDKDKDKAKSDNQSNDAKKDEEAQNADSAATQQSADQDDDGFFGSIWNAITPGP